MDGGLAGVTKAADAAAAAGGADDAGCVPAMRAVCSCFRCGGRRRCTCCAGGCRRSCTSPCTRQRPSRRSWHVGRGSPWQCRSSHWMGMRRNWTWLWPCIAGVCLPAAGALPRWLCPCGHRFVPSTVDFPLSARGAETELSLRHCIPECCRYAAHVAGSSEETATGGYRQGGKRKQEEKQEAEEEVDGLGFWLKVGRAHEQMERLHGTVIAGVEGHKHGQARLDARKRES